MPKGAVLLVTLEMTALLASTRDAHTVMCNPTHVGTSAVS